MIIYIVERPGGGVVAVYSDGLKAAALDHASRINGQVAEKDITQSDVVNIMAQVTEEQTEVKGGKD